jgi:hypothetical protein
VNAGGKRLVPPPQGIKINKEGMELMNEKAAKRIEQTISDKGTDAVKGYCYFCGAEVSGEFYCFGCKEFVCDNCESESPPMGPHDVSEHKS